MRRKDIHSGFKKKGLSLVLALAMTLGNVPVAAYAGEEAAGMKVLVGIEEQKEEKKLGEDSSEEGGVSGNAAENPNTGEKNPEGLDPSEINSEETDSKEETGKLEETLNPDNSSENPKEDAGKSNESTEIADPNQKTDSNNPTESDPNTGSGENKNSDANTSPDANINSDKNAGSDKKETSNKNEKKESSSKKDKTEKEDKEETEESGETDWLAELMSAGSTAAGGSSVEDSVKFVPGTYTISANLYVPGEKNTQLPGINAFMTNPDNPLGIVDENGSCNKAIPNVPVSGNATIVIGEDGTTKTLTIPVKNPVFTLQQINSGSDVELLSQNRNSTVYSDAGGNISRNGRITSITVSLKNNSGAYEFSDCVEFPTLLGAEWTVPLSLAVDLASLPQQSNPSVTPDPSDPDVTPSPSDPAVTPTPSVPNNSGENPDTPVMLEGEGSVWKKGSNENLLFRSSADFENFIKVTVDESEVDSKYYNAFSGSTFIELHADYLETLNAGSHILAIHSKDGTAKADFTVTEDPDPVQLTPGTYQITANVFLPGELNTELPGTTAYMTNPDNPLGIGGHNGIPMTPVSDNAVLVVGKDGAMTVVVDLVNPVFTLQKISDGETAGILAAVRDKEVYQGASGVESRNGRITKLYVSLKDQSGLYQFEDCVEFPTLLETDWKVPLQMSVDFSSAKQISRKNKIKIPENSGTGTDNGKDNNNNKNNDNKQKDDNNNNKNDNNQNNSNENTDPNAGTGTLKAGTYTVAANIWIDRASAGLPLSPHLTSSVFPPKDPVSNNAQVTIDESGNATVYVPIVIPSKVMSVKSISGLDIISTSTSGGYLSGITVNLGKVTNPNAVITTSCTVSLDLGELAQTIAHKDQAQVWAATFQVSFSGIPSAASGGGDVDVNALMAQSEKKQDQGVSTRLGILAEEPAVAFAWMMNAHKADKDKAQAAEAQSQKENSQASESQNGNANVAENYYIFTVVKLMDEEKSQLEQLEGEERTAKTEELNEKLRKDYLTAFADGKYEVILAQMEDAEWLLKEKKDFSFYIAGMIQYKNESEETVQRLVLVGKEFADKNPTVMQEMLVQIQDSVKNAAEKPEETSVYAFTFGIGENAGEVKEFLDENKVEMLQGQALEEAVQKMCEVLSDKILYDVEEEKSQGKADEDGSVATNDSAVSEKEDSSEVQTDPEEKIAITDADSLSAALDAALAKKAKADSETSEEKKAETGKESEASEAADSVSFSNSQGLDLEAEQAAAKELTPGTYTVSANMYLPGDLNTQLPGTTAYMTNPDNPLGIGGYEGIPMTPVSDNATLVVAEDGTKTVEIDLVNPVFTLQQITKPQNSKILAGVKDEERYEGTNGVGVDGRITKLYIQLEDDTAVYPFDDCHEFPTLLEADWYVVLEMSVEFTSAKKLSDDTTLEISEDSAGVATD